MEYLKIYQDYAVDATMVSNCFIDNYMKDANDAQLKVYLYLLRVLRANLSTNVSDIADKFNHTEKEVLRALKYWEKQGLLNLEYDDEKELTGIMLCEMGRNAAKGTVTVTQEAPVPVPLSDTPAAPLRSADQTSPASMYIKPNYSADELRAFKAQENIAQLLYVAEQYVGKPLTPTDIRTLLFLSDVLRFSDDLIDYLIQYCVERGKKDFRYMEKVAISWAEKGITTPEEAESENLRYDKSVYAIMNALGKSGTPTNKELEYITRWTGDYAFSNDIIFEACDRTVLATDKHRFEYAEGILSNWKRENVHRKADIARVDEQHQTGRRTNSAKTAAASGNRFNQIRQHDYDFEELEKKLLNH